MKKQIYNQNNSKKTIKGVPFLMIIKKADYHLHIYYLYSSKYQLSKYNSHIPETESKIPRRCTVRTKTAKTVEHHGLFLI